MANECIKCRKVTKMRIGNDDYYSCNGRTITRSSLEPPGQNCFVKVPSIFDDTPSSTFIIDDRVPGVMVYKYEIDAKTAEEAESLFAQGYRGREKGSTFYPDDVKSTIEIRKKR